MATFRVGVGSFNIKDGAVGFGTDTDGLGNLKVKGVTKTTGSIVSGASTLTRYSGFAADNINQLENITLTSEVGTIGDIVVGVGTSVIISSGSTVTVGTVESVSIGTHFSPPKGGIEERGDNFIEGMMRFNTDLNTMEFYNGNEWRQFTYISDIQNSPGSRGRAVITSGINDSSVMTNQYDFITITSLGNSVYFGDMIIGVRDKQGCGSAIRAIFGGGADGSTYKDAMDYVTIAAQGNAIDFGDLSAANVHNSALSSSTRGIWGGGYGPNLTNLIEYVEISTLGDALDFGDLSGDMSSGTAYHGSCASPVRGVFTGGTHPSSPAGDSVIRSAESITIASKGNSAKFAELTAKHQRNTAASNGVRGLVFSGKPAVVDISAIDMSSGGNAVHFGDLAQGDYSGFSCNNQVRAVHGGGDASPRINRIEFVSMNTFGNAQNFGELSCVGQSFLSATSDSHGGLGGY